MGYTYMVEFKNSKFLNQNSEYWPLIFHSPFPQLNVSLVSNRY